jgi:hypothetical protein
LGGKILEHKRDHTRLGCTASCILEDLFIIHRVVSSVCVGELEVCLVPFGAFGIGLGADRWWHDAVRSLTKVRQTRD